MIKPNVMRLYKSQYPLLTFGEIEAEINAFEKYVSDKTGINLASTDRQKYLRGWLLAANFKREKE